MKFECSETLIYRAPRGMGIDPVNRGLTVHLTFQIIPDEITIKSEKQCLKMQGGKLRTTDCNTMMYYTCERPADVSSKNKCTWSLILSLFTVTCSKTCIHVPNQMLERFHGLVLSSNTQYVLINLQGG